MIKIKKRYNEKNKTKLALYLQFLLKLKIDDVNAMLIADNSDFKAIQLVLNDILNKLHQFNQVCPDIAYRCNAVEELILIQDKFNKEADMIIKKSKKYRDVLNPIKWQLEQISKLGIYNAFNGVDATCLGYYSRKELFKKLDEMSEKPDFNPDTHVIIENSTGGAFVINNMKDLIKQGDDKNFQKFMDDYFGDENETELIGGEINDG